MEATVIKSELIDKMEHADQKQLEQLYGLVLNYFNGQDDVEEWDNLSEYQQGQINIGLAQAEAGLGAPAAEVIKGVREKYL